MSTMPRDDPDYVVDIDGLPAQQPQPSKSQSQDAKPWLAIKWQCCSAYSRIYRNKDGTAYEGRCPKCLRPVSVKIGPSGSHTRFFEAR